MPLIESQNLTPHANGLGEWSAQQIANALTAGMGKSLPVCDPMPSATAGDSFRGMTPSDALDVRPIPEKHRAQGQRHDPRLLQRLPQRRRRRDGGRTQLTNFGLRPARRRPLPKLVSSVRPLPRARLRMLGWVRVRARRCLAGARLRRARPRAFRPPRARRPRAAPRARSARPAPSSPRVMASTVAPVSPRRFELRERLARRPGCWRSSRTGTARRGRAGARGPSSASSPLGRLARARLARERLDDDLGARAHVALQVRGAAPEPDAERAHDQAGRTTGAAPGRKGWVRATSGMPTSSTIAELQRHDQRAAGRGREVQLAWLSRSGSARSASSTPSCRVSARCRPRTARRTARLPPSTAKRATVVPSSSAPPRTRRVVGDGQRGRDDQHREHAPHRAASGAPAGAAGALGWLLGARAQLLDPAAVERRERLQRLAAACGRRRRATGARRADQPRRGQGGDRRDRHRDRVEELAASRPATGRAPAMMNENSPICARLMPACTDVRVPLPVRNAPSATPTILPTMTTSVSTTHRRPSAARPAPGRSACRPRRRRSRRTCRAPAGPGARSCFSSPDSATSEPARKAPSATE